MRRNDCEKFIQKQDMGKDMGGMSDYEKMVMAAVVHDIGKFWQGAAGLVAKHHEAGKLTQSIWAAENPNNQRLSDIKRRKRGYGLNPFDFHFLRDSYRARLDFSTSFKEGCLKWT